MSCEVRLDPHAEAEILSSLAWYSSRSDLAARSFVHELMRVIARAVDSPERSPKYLHGARRIVFPRFPFSLVYRMKGEVLEVLAVAHQSRKPGYWKGR